MTGKLKKGEEDRLARKAGAVLGGIGGALWKAVFWPTSAVSYAIPPFRRLAGHKTYKGGVHALCIVSTLAGLAVTSIQEGVRVDNAHADAVDAILTQTVNPATQQGTIFPLAPVERSHVSVQRLLYGPDSKEVAIYEGQSLYDDRLDGNGVIICRDAFTAPAKSAPTYGSNADITVEQCRALTSPESDWSAGVPTSRPSFSYTVATQPDTGSLLDLAIEGVLASKIASDTASGATFDLGLVNNQGPYRVIYQGQAMIDDRIGGNNVIVCRKAYAVTAGQAADPSSAADSVLDCRMGGRRTTPWQDMIPLSAISISYGH